MRVSRLFLLTFLLLPETAVATGRRPLDAWSPELLPSGAVEVEFGLQSTWEAERVVFPGFKGDGWTFPVLGLRTGLGSWAELRLEGDAYHWFRPEDDSSVQGAGDFRVHTKVRIGRADARVTWAALIGVKIPVASDNDGLGTNLVDVEARALMGLAVGRGRFDLNGGIAVLGATFRERAQIDLLTYAVAYRHPIRDHFEINGEVAGREGGDFFPALAALRVGMRAGLGAWRLDGALAGGLTDASPSWELRLGGTWSFSRGPGDR